jgi:GntR family transcriptional regulator/MocR family aminotransferase
VREEALVARAAARGVGIYGISPYFQDRPNRSGFLLGYSRLTESDIREGIRLLGEIF